MLHFAKETGGANPIQDDQGQVGTAAFDEFLLDGTLGGGGETKDIPLFVFNDDANFKYNAPVLSIVDGDAVAEKSWFRLLDDSNVAGNAPTEQEFADFGISGDFTLTLDDISESSGSQPERKFWLRVVVPDGTDTANLSGMKIKVSGVEEAV